MGGEGRSQVQRVLSSVLVQMWPAIQRGQSGPGWPCSVPLLPVVGCHALLWEAHPWEHYNDSALWPGRRGWGQAGARAAGEQLFELCLTRGQTSIAAAMNNTWLTWSTENFSSLRFKSLSEISLFSTPKNLCYAPSGESRRQARPRPHPLGFPEGLRGHWSPWESPPCLEKELRRRELLSPGGSGKTWWKRPSW